MENKVIVAVNVAGMSLRVPLPNFFKKVPKGCFAVKGTPPCHSQVIPQQSHSRSSTPLQDPKDLFFRKVFFGTSEMSLLLVPSQS